MPSCDDALHHGSCLCGGVTVALRGEPTDVTICHCLTCQKAAGGAFVVAVGGTAASLTVASAEGTLGSYRTGRDTSRSFCTRCGTPVGFHYDAGTRDRISVWRGLFDAPDRFVPTRQIWTERRPDWVCAIATLPVHPKDVPLP